MFGRMRRQQQPTGIAPGALPGFGQVQQPQMSGLDKIGLLGGMVSDTFGGSGNAARMQNRVQGKMQQHLAQQQQARQAQLIQQMIGGAPAGQNGSSTGGFSPQMAAAAYLNPQAVAAAAAQQRFGHHTVGQGQSVVTYGPNGPQLTQAAQNFQNGSQIARMGSSGQVTSTDLGANAADRVNMRGQDITKQNNIATQGLRRDELNESIRATDIADVNTDFSNQTGRINAVTARDQANYAAANPTSDLGRSPLYMTDADGNVHIGQLGNGQVVKAQTPDGMNILSPYERGFQQSSGRSAGKAQGEAQGALPNALMRGQLALDTVDTMLEHPGLESAVGAFQGRLPGVAGDQKAFVEYANQAQGQAFMQAFESLKGGGQITEVEGLKAEQAMARMNRAQSEEDYKRALQDFRDVIERGMQTAQSRAGQGGAENDPLGIR